MCTKIFEISSSQFDIYIYGIKSKRDENHYIVDVKAGKTTRPIHSIF